MSAQADATTAFHGPEASRRYITGYLGISPRLFYRRWKQTSGSNPMLLVVHGQGENSGRYVHVGDFFAEAGFEMLAIDLRGHGRSEGRPLAIRAYSDWLEDIATAVGFLADRKVIVFGHSMGGGLVLTYARNPGTNVVGLIAASPWLRLTEPPPDWLVALAHAVSTVWPGYRFPTGVDSSKTSSDPEHLWSLKDLDLTHHFITYQVYLATVMAGENLLAHPEVKVPVLLAHGEADRVTSVKATRDYFERLSAPSKELITYPGLLHELHNERIRQAVLEDYLRWIRELIERSGQNGLSGPGGPE
ncbi:MAG: lysophospholipase [Verrucomicrobia bacterium]|nr:lysophospholipase [Verrucomicrobiota bacterium]